MKLSDYFMLENIDRGSDLLELFENVAGVWYFVDIVIVRPGRTHKLETHYRW